MGAKSPTLQGTRSPLARASRHDVLARRVDDAAARHRRVDVRLNARDEPALYLNEERGRHGEKGPTGKERAEAGRRWKHEARRWLARGAHGTTQRIKQRQHCIASMQGSGRAPGHLHEILRRN